ncbi:MAG: PQQ-binding-like beta-propeller repeat protein [Trueperaceae bacterium]|nr:PQQ-binding-like beta-propeller repeat protein [Trueperaceae bacterium]
MLIGLTAPLHAQAAPGEDADSPAFARTTLNLSLDAQEQLAEVQRLLDHGQSALALESLSRLLTSPDDQAVKRSALTKVYRHYLGVRQACRELLWGLWRRPGSGASNPSGADLLAQYRATYDGVAETLFRAALAARDLGGLARVAREYGPTSWGDDALLALGDAYAEAGDPAAALSFWEDLLSRWDAWAQPPAPWSAVVCRVAAAHLALGRADRAAAYVRGYPLAVRLTGALASFALADDGALRRAHTALARRIRSAPVCFGGDARPLAQAVRTLAAALKPGARAWSGDEWPNLAGGAEPRGLRRPVLALGPEAWTVSVFDVRNSGDVPTIHAPERQQAWGNTIVNLMDVGISTGLVLPFHPIVARGQVYALNDIQGRIYDLATGAARGTFGDFVLAPTGGFSAEDGLIKVPQGLSSRGRFLFAVKRATRRLRQPDRGSDDHEDQGAPPSSQLPMQGVAGFDLARGCRRLWDTHDVTDEASRAFYDAACFHGPPVADARSVYVGAYVIENDVKGYLCAIDAATGRLRWRTLLCAEQMSSFAAINPRPALAPVLAGDLVIFCTNQGVIGGFDAMTGELRWLLQYPRRMAYTYGGNVDRAPGWSDNPPFVHDRTLYLTPQDGEVLVVADVPTGRPLSFHPRHVEADADWRYLVGAPTGEVYLMGSRLSLHPGAASGNPHRPGSGLGRVLRLDPRNPGRPGVPVDLPDDIVGRGRAVAGYLYVPTRKGLALVDYRNPSAPELCDPLVGWADQERVARDALVLDSLVLIASSDGTLKAYPVKR